ncbi:hypothetical protein OF83DRAFT_678514 [Amylostereum chailletii]|nr:hypothetical protein OF83DRAFT_678514 [Amylostereum chailletii]
MTQGPGGGRGGVLLSMTDAHLPSASSPSFLGNLPRLPVLPPPISRPRVLSSLPPHEPPRPRPTSTSSRRGTPDPHARWRGSGGLGASPLLRPPSLGLGPRRERAMASLKSRNLRGDDARAPRTLASPPPRPFRSPEITRFKPAQTQEPHRSATRERGRSPCGGLGTPPGSWHLAPGTWNERSVRRMVERSRAPVPEARGRGREGDRTTGAGRAS